jgi:hypothetical protein
MSRIRSWLPVVVLFVALGLAQGAMIAWGVPSPTGESGSGPRWGWPEIIRDHGPIMERIPAPYVVLTVVGCAALAMVIWTLLVRWTDIDEAL